MTNKKTSYPSSLRSSGRRTSGYQTIRFASAIQIPENGNVILYTTDDGKSQVALYSRDGRVWLNQNQISDLFATTRPNITMHIANILEEGELEQYSVCKDFLLTDPDGKNYNVQYYSLENCNNWSQR